MQKGMFLNAMNFIEDHAAGLGIILSFLGFIAYVVYNEREARARKRLKKEFKQKEHHEGRQFEQYGQHSIAPEQTASPRAIRRKGHYARRKSRKVTDEVRRFEMAEYHFHGGNHLYGEGEFRDAIGDFKCCIELIRRHVRTHIELRRDYASMKHALSSLETSINDLRHAFNKGQRTYDQIMATSDKIEGSYNRFNRAFGELKDKFEKIPQQPSPSLIRRMASFFDAMRTMLG